MKKKKKRYHLACHKMFFFSSRHSEINFEANPKNVGIVLRKDFMASLMNF